jgi:adenylate cyclase
MSKLIVHDEHGQRSYDLQGTVSIGRHPNSIIRLFDPRVSKKHALVRRTRDGFVFEDLGSSNGSFFEGVRIQHHRLNDGDMIVMGKTALTYHTEMVHTDEIAPPVDISQSLEVSQVHDRVEMGTIEKFQPEREIADLNMLRIDYEKLRLGHELMKQIGFARSLSMILDTVTNEMLRIFLADRCVIMLASPDEGHLVPAVAKTMYGSSDRVTISESVLHEVRESRSAVLLSDTNKDERFSSSKSLIMQGIRSVMCAPIMQEGEFLGVLHIDSQRGQAIFSKKDLQLMTSIVRYVAMSIANVRLLRKVEQEARAKAQFERLLSPGVVDQIVAGKVKLEKGGRAA